MGGIIIASIWTVELQEDYDDLKKDHDDLEEDYDDLLEKYNSLFADLEALEKTLEKPLTNPVVPTISQVLSWLSEDNTDEINCTAVWQCGDFSVMLMTRAKEMNWRVRIACMFYSFSGETGFGNTHPYGSHGHAFNLIYCQDGNDPDSELDIYYIEPQTDKVWYVRSYYNYNHIHYSIYCYYTGGLSGTVWPNSYWVNHYGYFA